MSNEKFTPGPWRISEYEENKGKVYEYDGDLIATCTRGQSEYLANANIIAAAPDMYEALQAILNSNTKAQKEYSLGLAKAALAKATPQNK